MTVQCDTYSLIHFAVVALFMKQMRMYKVTKNTFWK